VNLTPRIALYRGRGTVGWLIKRQTRSVYSHAALLVPGSSDRVLESREFAGVQLTTLSEYDKTFIDWFAIPDMKPEQYERAFNFAMMQMGMKYDYWSVARFLTKVPARENDKWFCSELVHKAIAEGGTRLLCRIQSAEVSPGLLSYSPRLMQVSPPSP
jgi:uncharacterized protein YycO